MTEKHATHWLEREDQAELTIIRFRIYQLLDDDDTREVFDQIYSLVQDMRRESLVLNLGPVDYLSSLALGKLVMLNRKIQAVNGWLGLCALNPDVHKIFEITHLDRLLFIYDNEEQALQAFQVNLANRD